MVEPPSPIQPGDHKEHLPNLSDLEALARDAYSDLPEEFRSLCGDIIFSVSERASPDVLAQFGTDNPLEILGLFEGIGLAQDGGAPATGQLPNRIWLYRQAILAYWYSHNDSLQAIVTHVLIHEIGHHFGLSDDDMEAIEDAIS